MKRKALLATLVAALTLFATAFAFAGPRFGKGPWGGFEGNFEGRFGPGFSRGFWGVNLSEEQRAKILEIEKNFTTQAANLEAQLQAKILELRELQLKEASEDNAQSIRAKIGEILALRQELSALRKDMVQQVLSVLTPEQLRSLPLFGWGMGRRCF